MNNTKKCIVAVDAMGGDFAPKSIVIGGVNALNNYKDKLDVLLVGKQQEIEKVLKENNLSFPKENIINAPEVIEMAESPTSAIKSKPNSSINVCLQLVIDKKADAFISAGNTGAVMAGAKLKLGRIPGVGRPTIGSLVPTNKGYSMLFDVGASVDCKPFHLAEYALMGSIYVKEIFGIENPKVGLLSVGEEETKGNEVTISAHKILSESKLNFVGNVEGRDVLKGEVDVIVCDGFVGNILLKFAEGILGFLKTKFKEYAEISFVKKLKVGFAKNTLKNILSVFDYQKYGGVPLLGVNGIVIIGHGSSTPLAIENMILRAYEVFEKNLVERISLGIKEFSSNN
ncbi:MAG: phosphate acyltransferase PlsX [Ignavibacteria bacterium]|nr:phosphate acyltransferase PlsX [Ignavibacteria bacterium]